MVKKCMSDANPVNCMGSNFQASVFGSSSVKIESTSNLLGPFGRIINSVASIQKAFVNWLGTRTFGEILHKDFDGFLNFLWNQMETISDSSVLQKIPLLDGEYGWGEGCFNNKNRGGICAFRTRQLLSMQAFIAFTVGNLEHFPASVAYANIHSDIDGASRDSVAFAVTQKLASQGSVTTRCRYQLGCTFDKLSLADNTCGVPHSSFSHAEALVNAPFNLYWESDLLQNTLKFVGGSNRIGSGLTTDSGVCMTTTTQIGYGGQFDQVGPKYLKECKDRYFRKKL
ncbi:hypothetical protein HDV02_005691 [Globomyces sp. JEL0801]|nr:hypothetical protein HDV02_005691 [Globomyces sp. JEL0801]